MKINEITEPNLIWKELLEIDLDFDTPYVSVKNFSNTVLRIKHRSKYHIALNLIEEFRNRANEFLSATPFDPTDNDIISLQNKVKTMIHSLEEIEKLLR
jgi:hypothetical protein